MVSVSVKNDRFTCYLDSWYGNLDGFVGWSKGWQPHLAVLGLQRTTLGSVSS